MATATRAKASNDHPLTPESLSVPEDPGVVATVVSATVVSESGADVEVEVAADVEVVLGADVEVVGLDVDVEGVDVLLDGADVVGVVDDGGDVVAV